MNRQTLFTLMLACLLLAACTSLEGGQAVRTGSRTALAGPQIAAELNRRFTDQSAACMLTKPAYYCSGVLVRALPANHASTFWSHDAVATAVGAEGFAYLRTDVGTQTLEQPSGFVFSSYLGAVAQGKSLDVLCAYPLDSQMDADRGDYGCSPKSTVRGLHDEVPSSCAAVGVSTLSQWLAHFAQAGVERRKQCSLSTRDAVLFKISLEAHQHLSAAQIQLPNEVRVRNWDASVPARLPLEALFYDRTQDGGLLAAQRDQLDYFKATGVWLPILRMDLRDAPGPVFGFDLKEQLYIGATVASGLNARFADTSTICPGNKAAYYCNGVLLRSAEATTSFHAWDPSPNSIRYNGVSFSYLRADVGMTSLVFNRPHGFLFKSLDMPVAHPVELRCAYPYDVGTAGAPVDACTFKNRCEEIGITGVAQWSARYSGSRHGSCAFANTPGPFQVSIDVRATIPAALNEWNEIMIGTWPQGIPEQLPLEGFFYLAGSTGLAGAQFIQRDYYRMTKKFLPIVSINLQAAGANNFVYSPEDQSVAGVAVRAGAIPRRSAVSSEP